MADVEVRTVEPEADPLVFRVTVRDKTQSSHDVTVKRRGRARNRTST